MPSKENPSQGSINFTAATMQREIKGLNAALRKAKEENNKLRYQLSVEHAKNLGLTGDIINLNSRLTHYTWIDSGFKRASIFQRIKGIITGDFP